MEVDSYDDIAGPPVYTERGYDPLLPPIRERFPFLPEYEEDGSPKIELIVGRRPVDEKEDKNADEDDINDDADGTGSPSTRRRAVLKKSSSNRSDAIAPAEYEYLVKYKGRSYLHLEWKTGADLESMNKSAKGIYRRYLKKIAAGDSEELENPEFDPSYVVPQMVIDHAEQEFTVELTDKELLRWEKEREKEIAREKNEDEEEAGSPGKKSNASSSPNKTSSPAKSMEIETPDMQDSSDVVKDGKPIGS
jgi:hypothetical protein